MLNIGPHLSISKGYEHMGKEALSLGADTFQFFTRNPRGGKAKAIDPEDVKGLVKLVEEGKIRNILAHAPYTLNMAGAKEGTREFAKEVFRKDLDIMNMIPCSLYNFHPGSYTKDTLKIGTERIISTINGQLKKDDDVTVLLETMSGKGTEIGRSFEELKTIIDEIDLKHKMGVCLDTCHVFCAGYDIKNNLDGVLDEFDRVLGMERLKAVHLNDTKNDFKTFKDRHEKIGKGFLGLDAFINVINHEKLKNLPFFLETPNELDGYRDEIKLLRGHYTDE